MAKVTRTRRTWGGRRPGSGRIPGTGKKTALKVSVLKGIESAIRAQLPLTSYTLSGFVENAIIEKLRRDGVDVDAILKQSATPPR